MIAYLIIAHAQPDLVGDLVRALRSPVSAAFVHIDRKANIEPFMKLKHDDAILISQRAKVYWGGWSQVQATLNLIRAAVTDGRPFTHFALISGVDYPLVRSEMLLPYLQGAGLEYINCVPMPSVETEKPLNRLTVRRREGEDRQRGLRQKIIAAANQCLKRFPERELTECLGTFQPHAGSQWWILSRPMVERALKISDENGALVRTFKTSQCPDESYFQTIVASSVPAERIGRAFTYTDWSTPNPPAIIDDRHVSILTSPKFRLTGPYGTAPCLFVRKFPAGRSDLQEKIDAYAAERSLDPITDRPIGAEAMLRRTS